MKIPLDKISLKKSALQKISNVLKNLPFTIKKINFNKGNRK